MGLPWEPLGTRWAQAALHPGAGASPHTGPPCSSLLSSQHPVSSVHRCPPQQRGRMGAHPDPVEGLTRPGSSFQPSLTTDLWLVFLN